MSWRQARAGQDWQARKGGWEERAQCCENFCVLFQTHKLWKLVCENKRGDCSVGQAHLFPSHLHHFLLTSDLSQLVLCPGSQWKMDRSEVNTKETGGCEVGHILAGRQSWLSSFDSVTLLHKHQFLLALTCFPLTLLSQWCFRHPSPEPLGLSQDWVLWSKLLKRWGGWV